MQDNDETNTETNAKESPTGEVEAKEDSAQEPQKLFSETEAAKVASLFAFSAAMMLFSLQLLSIFKYIPTLLKILNAMDVDLPTITQLMLSPAVPGLIILLMAGLAVKEKFLKRPMLNLYINGASIILAYIINALLEQAFFLPLFQLMNVVGS